jgi:hypothetical protein
LVLFLKTLLQNTSGIIYEISKRASFYTPASDWEEFKKPKVHIECVGNQRATKTLENEIENQAVTHQQSFGTGGEFGGRW